MQEQMSNVSRELETLRQKQKEMRENKTPVAERKNVFDGLISRLETAKWRVIELKRISMEASQTEMQREKRWKQNTKKTNTTEHPGTEGQFLKV